MLKTCKVNLESCRGADLELTFLNNWAKVHIQGSGLGSA